MSKCEGSKLDNRQVAQIRQMISRYELGMSICSCDVERVLNNGEKKEVKQNKKYKVTFKDGKHDVVTGNIHLFNETVPSIPIKDNIHVYNAGEVLSIKEIIEGEVQEIHLNGFS